ncbi:MAG TPA: ABC transporter permease [Fimbriimonadaceae bacterium]|nr:ABC transporter permease [Fimbriimonadaceae bacterium]
MKRSAPFGWAVVCAPALLLVIIPLLALTGRSSASRILYALGREETQSAIALSIRTTVLSALIVAFIGLPLAFFLARCRHWLAKIADAISDTPIVLPPAAAGIALLAAFGREGLVGSKLDEWGIQIVFTSTAVVVAQCFVALPYFVRSATEGFRNLDSDTFAAAAIDGATGVRSFWHIAAPQARAAILAGLLLAWARALGEFGATLMFAGNFVGRTQTMPLAVYSGFEGDLDIAISLSVILMAIALLVILAARWVGRTRTA